MRRDLARWRALAEAEALEHDDLAGRILADLRRELAGGGRDEFLAGLAVEVACLILHELGLRRTIIDDRHRADRFEDALHGEFASRPGRQLKKDPARLHARIVALWDQASAAGKSKNAAAPEIAAQVFRTPDYVRSLLQSKNLAKLRAKTTTT